MLEEPPGSCRIMAGNALDRPGVQAALVVAGFHQPIAPFDQVSGDVDSVMEAMDKIAWVLTRVIGSPPRRIQS